MTFRVGYFGRGFDSHRLHKLKKEITMLEKYWFIVPIILFAIAIIIHKKFISHKPFGITDREFNISIALNTCCALAGMSIGIAIGRFI